MFAYELLYRDGTDNCYDCIDGDNATSQVLNNSFNVIGIKNITQGKKAFVNFTKNLIEKELVKSFDNDILVVEVLEDVEITAKVINACRKLKKDNYIIALDDFVFEPCYRPLLKIADIVKVDFLITSKKQRAQIVDLADQYGVDLLAEKIETESEFQEAKQMGYSYFQGYFFKKPEILEGNDLPVYPGNYFRVLNELNHQDPDFDKIAKVIKQDMSLSYKLLSFINSAAFGFRQEIESIKHALVLLGIKEIKKWFNLVVLKQLATEKPKEVMRVSLIRAKLSEFLGTQIVKEVETSKLFMMGLFSMIDVLMNRELEELLAELPIANEIKAGLLGEKGLFRDIYQLVLAYEEGKWEQVNYYIEKLELEEELVTKSFVESINWAEGIFTEKEK